VAKRLVVCCDGTWNVPDQKDGDSICPSNVAKMALAVADSDGQGKQQRVYYQRGVGTGARDHLRGGAFGWGLSSHIQDAYRFLIEEYEDGDAVFLFGFSRGAYTARSIAGFIRNSGLLKREHRDQLDAAYALYRRRDDASHPTGFEAQLFRRAFSREIRITFIGVWDTVGSLGIPSGLPGLPGGLLQLINKRWGFHDVKLSSYVDNAFHAVAIDERRRQFEPTLWEQQEHSLGQNMEQVWFTGVHTNIGGGDLDTGLSDLTFLWMKDKAQAAGLAFDQAYIAQTIKPNPLGAMRDSKVGIYRLFRDDIRPIGKAVNGNEAVAQSSVDRMQRDQSYDPPNLIAYLDDFGPVVPVEE
jgi:uncharacterized protein (DUF2235 family)